MLRITIELVPHGVESRKRVLGQAIIANDGTGTHDTGNYNVRLMKWGPGERAWKRGRVVGFPRLKLGPWDLLFCALRNCVGHRNVETCPLHAGAIASQEKGE